MGVVGNLTIQQNPKRKKILNIFSFFELCFYLQKNLVIFLPVKCTENKNDNFEMTMIVFLQNRIKNVTIARIQKILWKRDILIEGVV